MPSLYNEAHEFRALAESLYARDDLDEKTINDTLDGAAYSLETKAEQVMMFVANEEAIADAIEKQVSAMQARAKAHRKKADRLKEYVFKCVKLTNRTSIETPNFKIRIAKNPEKVEVYDEGYVPSGYWRAGPKQEFFPDKKVIAEAIKSGKDVPGARLAQDERLEVS